jgi:CheY-like chemotaxis protein
VVNGKEVLFRLRENERFKNIPVIVFTTSSFSFDQEFAAKYNAGFIVKPLHIEKMKDVVNQFLNFCSVSIA